MTLKRVIEINFVGVKIAILPCDAFISSSSFEAYAVAARFVYVYHRYQRRHRRRKTKLHIWENPNLSQHIFSRSIAIYTQFRV